MSTIIDLKNVTMTIKDGGANSVEIKIGEGQMRYDETKTRIYRKNRGQLDEVVDGDEEPMDVSFDFQWEYLLSDTGVAPSVEDALKQRGEAAAWVSSDSNTCSPYAVDIELRNVVDCGAEDDEVILLPDFRYEKLSHDARGQSVSVSGKCNATEATITRVAGA
jgi:hypothetical protein